MLWRSFLSWYVQWVEILTRSHSRLPTLRMTPWSRDQLRQLDLEAFLTLYKENEFPLELGRHLTLDQCEALIPDGPGGWRKVSSVLMCLVRWERILANMPTKNGKHSQMAHNTCIFRLSLSSLIFICREAQHFRGTAEEIRQEALRWDNQCLLAIS